MNEQNEVNEVTEVKEVPVMYVPASQIHKSVRNILCNEMGVTADSVHKMVDAKVERAVKDRVDRIFESNHIDQFIAKQIGQALGGSSWNSTPLKDYIKSAIEKQIAQLVGSSLKVELHLEHNPQSKETK